jgi:sperm-associated antigen 16 protein
MALRGHVDSVNSVAWQPFGVAVATASSDKTVSVWDARSGLCAQTFYGHTNSCNAAAFSLRADTLASTDADGNVKLWDTRMVAEILSLATGKAAANKVAFDRSGQVKVALNQMHNVLRCIREPCTFCMCMG